AARVDGDLLGQVAVRDRGGDVRDVSDLRGQVGGEDVDVVGQVLPGSADALHVGLRAELAFGADLLRDARDLDGKRVRLVEHLVDDVLDLEDLAFHVDGDLLRQVAGGDRGRDLRHVTELHREVRGHRVDVVGEVLPRAVDAFDVGLAAELALGSDLLRDARD